MCRIFFLENPIFKQGVMRMEFFKKLWSGFNHWRRKYCFTRTLIIILIFFPLTYELLSEHLIIRDLVRIACDGIFVSSIPQSENALCKYYKFKEKRRLQFQIKKFADKNGDKILDKDEIAVLKNRGCDIDAIFQRATALDLNKLAKNATILGLLPPGYSTKKVRLKAFFAAHAENEYFYNPLKEKVYHLLEQGGRFFPEYSAEEMAMFQRVYSDEELASGTVFPNYGSWGTWKHGALVFGENIKYLFAPSSAFMTWFIVSLLISLLIKLHFEKYTTILSIAGSLLFLYLTLHMQNFKNLYYFGDIHVFWNIITFWIAMFSLVCLSVAAALYGMKIGQLIKNRALWRIIVLFLLGLAIFIRNLNILSYSGISWYSGFGDYVKPSSYIGITIWNEVLLISFIIMATALIKGWFYYGDKINKKNQE